MRNPPLMMCLGLSVLAALAGGCRGGAAGGRSGPRDLPPPTHEGIVAGFHEQQITAEEFQKVLTEAYGFKLLQNLVQLHAAEAAAKRRNIKITEADVQAEHDKALMELARESKDKRLDELDAAEEKGDKAKADEIRRAIYLDNEPMLDQYLNQKRLTRAEFRISLRTSAYLRKLVEPTVDNAITDKMIEDAYRFRYGEKVLVSHIQCRNPQQIAEVKRRLARKEDFGDLAVAFSENSMTARLRGELPPFSRETQGFSPEFVKVAFTLKEGEVSDMVATGGAYHLIKMHKRIDPVAVKLADVREPLRRELRSAMIAKGMMQLRQDHVDVAMASLRIYDPVLKAEFQKLADENNTRRMSREDALRKMDQVRAEAERAAATQPAATTTAPATAPVAPPMEPATTPAPVPATAPAPKQ